MTRGMNMRDMKARQMARKKEVSGFGFQVSAPEKSSVLKPKPETRNPKPSSEDLPVQDTGDDDLELTVLVDQGDGMYASGRGYDGGDDGIELPDEAPPGWGQG